jgi:hypothetical protein
LRIKGLKLGEIAKELSSAYGPDAYTPPSIKYWLHQIKPGRTDLRTQHTGGWLPLDEIDAGILAFLRKSPFSSVRTIAESLEIPVSTIYSHSVHKVGLKIFFLLWVPYTVTSGLQQKRVELSSQLLRVLESQQRVGFRDIVTGDESWFLQYYNHRKIWCISANEMPTRVRYMTAALNTILTVFWSIDGAILINRLTPGEKFDNHSFCEKIFELLSEILHDGRTAGSPRPIVHFDNVIPDRSAATKITFNFVNSDMPLSRPTVRRSVQVTSFYSVIWKGNLINTMEEFQARAEGYLVSCHQKQCNESISTGSRDCSNWYIPMETTSKAKYYHRNSISVEESHHS